MAASSLLRLCLLGGIWGMSFIFLRIAAPVFGPLLTTSARVAFGALLLLLLVRLAGVPMQWRKRIRFHFVVGLSNTALPFFLFSWAAVRTPSAYLATINAMAPLFAAVFARVLTGERLSVQRLAGFAAGMAGVAVLVGLGPARPDPELLAGVAAGLGAAACYGYAAVHVRRFGGSLPALAIASGSLLAATLLLLPIALVVLVTTPLPAATLTPAALWQPGLAVLLLGLVCTGLAYAVYFRLVADEGVTRAVTVTFLVPLAATLWGILLLHEHVTAATLGGIVLVLSGTALSLGLPAIARAVQFLERRAAPKCP